MSFWIILSGSETIIIIKVQERSKSISVRRKHTMAKKKSAKIKAPKPRPKLETVFDCPFCNHSLCVEIKLWVFLSVRVSTAYKFLLTGVLLSRWKFKITEKFVQLYGRKKFNLHSFRSLILLYMIPWPIDSIFVSSERDRRIGSLKCRICSTSHSSRIHHLSAAVDVYCDWIDECHKVNTKGGAGSSSRARATAAAEVSDWTSSTFTAYENLTFP